MLVIVVGFPHVNRGRQRTAPSQVPGGESSESYEGSKKREREGRGPQIGQKSP